MEKIAKSTPDSRQSRLHQLRDRESMLRRLAAVSAQLGCDEQWRAGLRQAELVREQRELLESGPEDGQGGA